MPLNQFPRRSFVGSSTLQTFTGNGTQTVFTLSSAQTQNEVFLFVDDVAQVPGVDFTVSGTTLTFTVAPANAAEIIARGFGVPAPVTTVSDGTITSAKLASGAIEAKLGYTPVSPTQLSTEVNNIIASAPGALNTLDELAAALGDDANYAATITTALSAKANTSSLGTLATVSPTGTADNTKFLRGDNSWQVVSVTPTAVSSQANSATDYFALPSGTTAQRPANPTGNMIRKNTTTGYIEYYDSSISQWIGLGSFQANGGSITQSGGYNLHTFTSSGNFTVTAGTKGVEVLVVAAGGGGGFQVGGGGGAGGLVYTSSTTVPPGVYAVTIGAGGNGAPGSTTQGTNGSNSAFGSLITAIGGGRGSNHDAATSVAGSGGSGGGGSGNSSSQNVPGGAGTSGQGNTGGTGLASNWAGGGGGGAGAAGGSASPNTGGNGGPGTFFSQFASWGTSNPNTYSNGAAVQNGGGWFAGGGGGSMNNQTASSYFSNGGAGGGGRGYADNGLAVGGSTHGEDGASNTGGGGGGVRDSYGGAAYTRAGNGGSGIVIIRYLA
jgi:hypothetical protein